RSFLQRSAQGAAGGMLAGQAAADDKPTTKTSLIYDEEYKKHRTGEHHPEHPQRLAAVVDALKQEKLWERLTHLRPQQCEQADLLSCHDADYIKSIDRDVAAGRTHLAVGDTSICPDSPAVARLAAGGAILAVDQVVSGNVRNAFCAARPPGHHATPDKGMGFCLFNNVAIAARRAQRKHGVGKVLISDWDVHHGNGTQDVFHEDPSVFFFSTHQSPWYPGTGAAEDTGEGKGKGTTLNQPFPSGSGRKEVVGAFTDKLAPQMARFKPELVILSAGFDSRMGDPLGQYTLTDEDIVELTKIMMGLADEFAGGRLVSILEGGYNLDGLGKAAAAHVGQLLKTS
ncbi:MAG: histone deacetylase, partial [Planctomycetales bacterium]